MDKTSKIKTATKKLRKNLTIQRIRKIPKYKDITMAQCLSLITNIEHIAILLLESYALTKANTS